MFGHKSSLKPSKEQNVAYRAAEFLIDGEVIEDQASIGVAMTYVTNRGLRIITRGPGKVNEFFPWSRITAATMTGNMGARHLFVTVMDRQHKLPCAYNDSPRILKAIQSRMV